MNSVDLTADLPPHWSTRVPSAQDVTALVRLVARHHEATRGSSSADEAAVALAIAGHASWTRRQLLVSDQEGEVRAWVRVHDRAAGRTVVDLTVDPGSPERHDLAALLFAWSEATALEISALRGLDGTQLDRGRHVGDE
ncbi:MAG: GNAT family N-acetyltransferase, partial [Pedococcus sp.]